MLELIIVVKKALQEKGGRAFLTQKLKQSCLREVLKQVKDSGGNVLKIYC